MEIEQVKKAFQLFASTDQRRTIPKTVFRQVDKYFATDAHALMWIGADKIELECETIDKPNCHEIIPKESNCNDIIDVSLLKSGLVPDMVFSFTECNTCRDGKCQCENCNNDHDCGHCDGTGKIIDESLPKMPNPEKVFRMLGVAYKYNQLNRLIRACELLGITHLTKTFGTPTKSSLFISGNINFLLCPSFASENETKITF